ncbi:MAG: GtrA family protein [Acholeplasmatales bacterium]|jgi:putative flippase GtrA|nr:GtrA family protein [Acholeplasmatales bacterium]
MPESKLPIKVDDTHENDLPSVSSKPIVLVSTPILKENMVDEKTAKKANSRKNFIQFLKFTLFMVGAALVQVFTFFIMNDLIKIPWVWVSNVLSIVFSVIFSFTFNRKFTFKEANNVFLAMALVTAYYLVFTPLSGWFARAFENKIHAWLIEGISMVVNFITEYLFNKFVVYRKRKPKKIDETSSEDYLNIQTDPQNYISDISTTSPVEPEDQRRKKPTSKNKDD